MIVFLSVKYNDSPKQLNFSKILPYIVWFFKFMGEDRETIVHHFRCNKHP
jgi:hypothetical protein